jgi:transcriptional regulator with XRE-family HTH domain
MPFSKTQKKQLKLLGEKVKLLREGKHLTLKQLAHSIGKDPQSIHWLEQGGVNPGYLYLLQICEGLEIDIVQLLSDIPE